MSFPKIVFYSLFICLFPFLSNAQSNQLEAFEVLTNKTWIAEGKWSNGQVFKQEISFEYDLDHSIVKTTALGFTDQKQSTYGKRNHGIRQWDQTKQVIRFWEFDVFGSVTTGIVKVDGNNFYYQYEYPGPEGSTLVTDAWEKIDAYNYKFIVGQYLEGEWKQKYLETTFTQKPKHIGSIEEIQQILKNVKQFSTDVVAGDFSAVAGAYTSDAKIFPSNLPIIDGQNTIYKYWQPTQGGSYSKHQIIPLEIEIIGDTANDYGYYNGVFVNKEGKENPFKGKYVIVWKKIDGQWKIYLDIWNRVND